MRDTREDFNYIYDTTQAEQVLINVRQLIEKYGGAKPFSAKMSQSSSNVYKHIADLKKGKISRTFLSTLQRNFNYTSDELRLQNINVWYRTKMFDHAYSVYFLVTQKRAATTKRYIDKGTLFIDRGTASLSVDLQNGKSKSYEGEFVVRDEIFSLRLQQTEPAADNNNAETHISLARPKALKLNSPHAIYYGGLGLMVMPSHNGTYPCAQCVLVCKTKSDFADIYDLSNQEHKEQITDWLNRGCKYNSDGRTFMTLQEDLNKEVAAILISKHG